MVFEVGKQEYIPHKELGHHDYFEGIDILFDPEKYVDSNIQLCKRKIEANVLMRVWTMINSNVTTELYHVYQEWTNRFKIDKPKKSERHYSFLGLYRKFSMADVHELIYFDENKEKPERELDITSLFANFYGNSVFTIFFNELNLLRFIADYLEKREFPRETYLDFYSKEIEVENQDKRRLYMMLSKHELGSSIDNNRVIKCNSLIYKSLHSE